MLWGKGVFLSFLAEDRSYPARQTDEVWEAFNHLKVCVSVREFIPASPWGKLCVHARIFVLLGTHPVCGLEETLDHALRMCRLYTAVRCIMSAHLPNGIHGVSVQDLFLPQHRLLSLEYPPRVVLWLARASFWKVRWLAKEGA